MNALKVAIFVINLSLLVVLVYFLVQLKSDTTACITNPFTYGAQKVNEVSSSPLTCSCRFENASYASFEYDAEKITPQQQPSDSRAFYYGSNLSDIIKFYNVSEK